MTEIPKEFKSAEEGAEWLAKYKSNPNAMEKRFKMVLENWLRKSIKKLKGQELLNFLEMIDRELPWEDFFLDDGGDLFAIVFALTTYNEKYCICNSQFTFNTEAFGGQNI